MKKLLLGILALVALAGCAPVQTGQTASPAQLLAQVNTQVCPFVVAAQGVLPSITGLTPDVMTKATDAVGKAVAACAKLADVSAAATAAPSLQDLADNALPMVLNVLMAIPDPDPAVVAAKNGLIIAKAFLPGIIAQFKAAQPVATAATPAK